MFIDVIQNNGKPYLRLVNSIRVENKKGKKVSQKKVELYIGPQDKFDDGKPNYVERLRKSFKNGNPLIPALLPYCEKNTPREEYRFVFQQGSPDCHGATKLYSHCLLERILDELGLRNLFASYKHFSKAEFDIYGFFKLLVCGRILNPASKSATIRQNDDYYEPILKDFNPDNVFDTLDFIYEHKSKIMRRMNTSLIKKTGRNTDLIYYDVTNFYFEIEDPDDDVYDDEGNISSNGLRRNGVSKEHRKQPIVQMGLFMDSDGIPIAIDTFPGNTLDHLTALPALRSGIDDLELSRFIFVGDRGISKYPALLHLLDAKNGYIVAKSILKSTKQEQAWITDEDGYVYRGRDFKYKSRVIKRSVRDEAGNMRNIDEKVVSYWSRNFQKRAEKENKSFLEFLDRLIQSPTSFRVTKTQAGSLRRFLKKEFYSVKTGEVFDSSELRAMIDLEKVNAYKEYFGYYQIVTSELEMDPLEVIDKYHGLSMIEDQFRVMKGTLDTRPIFVRTREHIEAHLCVCFIALVIMRIIQRKTAAVLPSAKEKGIGWTMGLSGARVQSALNKWQVEHLQNDFFRVLNTHDADLQTILKAFEVDIPLKLFRRGELKSIKTAIKNVM